METNKTPSYRVQLSVDYRSAPIQLIEDTSISTDARVLASWVLMHGNGWEFKIGYALQQVGISEKKWQTKVRKELLARGYFIQNKGRGVSKNGREGVIVWENILTDEPLRSSNSPSPQKVGMQEVGMQKVAMPKGGNTVASVNRGSSSQKRESKGAASSASKAAATTADEAFDKLLDAASKVNGADLERDQAALADARDLCTRFKLSDAEVVAILAECKYPSQAGKALEAAGKAKQANQGEKNREKAKQEMIERINSQIQSKKPPKGIRLLDMLNKTSTSARTLS